MHANNFSAQRFLDARVGRDLYSTVMLHRILAIAWLAVAPSIAAAGDRADGQDKAPRTRNVYVSVVDRNDAPVKGLKAADFVVREDGVAREVLKAEPATAPLQIMLVVDDSAAADPAIRDIREGLNAFVTKLDGKAEIGLITIGERPTSVVELTTSADRVHKGVSRIFARTDSGAYFLEGLSDVTRGFQKREATRPVIVAVVTEGVEFSNLHYTPVLDQLYASRAALHVLSLGRPSDATTDEIRNRNMVIAEGTRRTGGRRDQVLANSGLPSRLQHLADELLNQYVVTYGAPDQLIPPEKLDVSVKRPDVTVRARSRVQGK